MAEPLHSFFNKKALDRINNPDDLNKSLRIANPGFFVAIIACVVFIAGFVIWAVFGTITETLSVTGVVMDGQVYCFPDDSKGSGVNVGDSVNVEGIQMTVSFKSEIPLSAAETREIIHSDYLEYKLVEGEWVYFIKIEGDTSSLEELDLVKVTIITTSESPISLILGGED